MKTRSIIFFAPALLLLTAAGCVSSQSSFPQTYLPGYQYVPQPVMATIFTREQKPAVNVLVSVMGIHQADQSVPLSVELRLRMENTGVAAATLDPRSMELVSGSLQPFDAPLVRPPQPLQVAPGQTGTMTTFFRFPAGSNFQTMGLETLRLRWQVLIDNKPIEQTAYFERATPQNYGAR